MDWATKKFNYKIINVDDKENVIGFVRKKLDELEDFAKKSGLQIKKLQRSGPDDFIVEVLKEPGWKN